MTRQPINTILFDLDGTLLPLDQDQFIQDYFSRFVIKGQELGYSPELLLTALQRGITTMVLNDGSLSNKERFDRVFEESSGINAAEFNERFAPFYHHEFDLLRRHASPSPFAREIVQEVKRKGYTVVLATNPLFPWQGTEARLGWAYLASSQFSLVTTYEDFHYAKPNLDYYRQILQLLGKEASSCLMVGNDVEEDMVARELGMEVYLVTDYLINNKNKDISGYRTGSLQELATFIKELPPCNS
ncbi:HAD family hydrolase [uncultured Sphaerochaeta sp.]|uniref:HAD family hydrolase n=1 Tax=uncultured Sphaerochaeta sp. TaxID=886478 RepID=UPI0029CA9930|nr:HAD family hydrolase [uncultured Sphaerochaeta sp.]